MMTTTSASDPIALDAQHVLQVYKRAPVIFDHGRGCSLFTRAGDRYLDLISGVGVASLGHAHPKLAAAIADQAATLLHTSNLFHHPLQSEVAARLSTLSGLPRAFFCNSGAEAVEACLKFARRYWHTQGATGRTGIVAFQHSFHGRTMGALSATWDVHYREPFAPLVPSVSFVDPSSPAAIINAVTENTAAVIVEPLQGEGGVRPIPQAAADAIAAACRATASLLIADEVQCGLGRTGRLFYSAALGLKPDLMALGKALGAGVPIGAALFSEKVAGAAKPGDHGSTYGGNLLACRAALVFLDELSNGLLDNVRLSGAYLESGLRAIAARQPAIKDIRGAGLMWGIELDRPAAPVVEAALQRKLLINRTSDTVLRLLPPYVITQKEIDEALPLLEQAIAAALETRK